MVPPAQGTVVTLVNCYLQVYHNKLRELGVDPQKVLEEAIENSWGERT